MNTAIAFPIESRGAPIDVRTPITISEVTQLPDLLVRHPTVRLYGELDGIVFTGDEIDQEALRAIAFWWSARA